MVLRALCSSLAISKNFALLSLLSSLYIRVLWAEPTLLLSFSHSLTSFSFESSLSMNIDFSFEQRASLEAMALLVMPVCEVCALVEERLVVLSDSSISFCSRLLLSSSSLLSLLISFSFCFMTLISNNNSEFSFILRVMSFSFPLNILSLLLATCCRLSSTCMRCRLS